MGIKERIEVLQKQMDAQKPNGGILVRLNSGAWMAFSAGTIHKKDGLCNRSRSAGGIGRLQINS